MCKTVGNKTPGKKFDSKTKQVEDSQNCKTNKDLQAKADESSWSKDKTNMPHYLFSDSIFSGTE